MIVSRDTSGASYRPLPNLLRHLSHAVFAPLALSHVETAEDRPPRSVGTACGPSHFIAMTIDEFMHALERARAHALPGHEAVGDHVLRELRRLLEQREMRLRAPIRLRLVRD